MTSAIRSTVRSIPSRNFSAPPATARSRDVAGYRIERRVDQGGWAAVGPATIETPSFLDSGVAVGQRVGYRVLAFDRAQPANISPPSETVELELVAEPGTPGPAER